MINPSSFFKNPIIRAFCVALILYFALFNNKENPNSLGNRLSADKIKHNLSEAKEKGSAIMSYLELAKQTQNTNQNNEKIEIAPLVGDHIIIEDQKIGVGDTSLSCLDEAEISYVIYPKNDNHHIISSVEKKKLIIGSKDDLLLENKLIGMKKSGVRLINVFKNFKTEDPLLAKFLQESDTDLIYQVSLIDFTSNIEAKSQNIKCK
jgi:hypothetical protein